MRIQISKLSPGRWSVNAVRLTHHLSERWQEEHKPTFAARLSTEPKKKNLTLKRHWVDGKAKEMSISKTKVYFKIQLSSLKLLKISAGYGDECSWLFFWLLLNRMSQSSYRVKTVVMLKRGSFGSKYFSFEGKTKKVGQKSWKWLHTGTRVFQTHQSEKWAIKSKLLRQNFLHWGVLKIPDAWKTSITQDF